jgi:hypothetical protein
MIYCSLLKLIASALQKDIVENMKNTRHKVGENIYKYL